MIVPLPDVVLAPEALGAVHFVGIGGAALSGLARLMAARGVAVSGSDAQDSPVLESLRALGIECFVGHAADHVDGKDTVVVSTAVPADNPEVVRARRDGLRVWPRAAAVQSLLSGRRAVVVTGTHGKTTTTSMLVTALLACGADPSYAVGSTLHTTGVNAAAGDGPLFVVEGDESDAAILAYRPFGAVVTNVDVDHLDFFGTAEAYARVFDDFLGCVQPGGFLVCGVDDAGGRRLASVAADRGLRTVTVSAGGEGDPTTAARIHGDLSHGEGVDGPPAAAALRATDIVATPTGSTSEVWAGRERLGSMALSVPGPVYVADALAALAAGLELGLPFDGLARGLAEFRGTGRRMELKGTAAGVRVYDSYAHHPVEITGDLRAARELAAGGRVLVCFQPHLFSRTLAFAAQMGRALGAADGVVVMDVYPAREAPVPGVTGELVARAVPLAESDVVFEPDRRVAAARVAAMAGPGDLVLTLGAGDVTLLGPEVLMLLAERSKER